LSEWGGIGLGIGLQEVGGEMAQAQLREQRQAVVYDVKQAYYGILQTLSGLDAMEESLKSYRELDRLVGNYVVQQKALKADHLEVQTRLAKADYDALTLRHALATQQEQLNFLLGLDMQATFQVSPVSETVIYAEDVEVASRRALTQRPELQQVQLKVKQAEYDRRMKQAEYIPDVSLAFTYLTPFNVEFLPQNVASVGVLLSWELFDWGRKHREIAEKRKTERQAVNTVADTAITLQLEVRSKLRTLQEKAALLRVHQLAQETTVEKLRTVMQKYTQQATLLQDVLQAQADLARANAEYRQGLAAFWTARADFEKALGED
jgi:outer membrane protein